MNEDKDNLNEDNQELNESFGSMFDDVSNEDSVEELDIETSMTSGVEDQTEEIKNEYDVESQEIENNEANDNETDIVQTEALDEVIGIEQNDTEASEIQEDVLLDEQSETKIEEIQDFSSQEALNQRFEDIISQDETNQEEFVTSEMEDEDEEQPGGMITVRPVKFQQFPEAKKNRQIKRNLDILQDVNLHVVVELGRTNITIRDVMNFEVGSIVELDKIAGDQVEVFVEDKLVAKGEVLIIDENFGVRVTATNLQA